MEIVIASLVATLATIVAYRMMPLAANYWTKGLRETLSEEEAAAPLPFWRGLLTTFGPAVRYTPVGFVKSVEGQLYWAKLVGKWPGWSLPEIIALHLALAVAGFLIGSLLIGDVVFTILSTVLLPALMNMTYLRGPARKAKRQMGAELPEFVALLAAETGADIALSEAIVRLSRGAGLCAEWFRRVLSRQGVGGLFTGSGVEGGLRAEALESGDPELIGLATSLDNVAKRGTGTRELLAQVAVSTANRYVGESNQRAERIGNELLLPMMVFFFMPYVALLLFVMASPLFNGSLF